MFSDVSVIIYLLKKIDEDETIDSEMINKAIHPLVKAVVYLADEYLTGDDNFKNIITVRKAGYDVYAGEQDSFGWLTGCIEMKRGVIVFG
jgi:hypothetical protein